MSQATVNVAYPLRCLVADGATGLYPQAKLYSAAGALLATVPLPHIAEGMYGADHTYTAIEHTSAVYTIYTDSGHTIAAAYDKESEEIDVIATIPNAVLDSLLSAHLTADTVGESLSIIRGLVQQNFVLDTPVYNASNLLTSARIRIFPTAADLSAGTNAIATYTMTAVADTDTSRPASYKMVKS